MSNNKLNEIENTENTENIENIENTENTENTENIVKIEVLGDIEEELLEEEFIENNEDNNSKNNNVIENEDNDFEIMFKKTANKHKLEGTHALKRDTIILGKKEEEENDNLHETTDFFNNTFEIEKGTNFDYETHNNEDYIYKKELTQDIYDILDNQTDIKFLENRRKPNKLTFNKYYDMCISELSIKYTKSEIFVELSYYFTDKIFNMFKLLNKKNASGIIKELKDKGFLNDIQNINFI